MDLLVAKILSGLVLWILSLCFGLMIPYVLWKTRAGYQALSNNNQQVSETESLLRDEENQVDYRSIPNQNVRPLETVKV